MAAGGAANGSEWPLRYGQHVEPIWSIFFLNVFVFVYGAYVSWVCTGSVLIAIPSLVQLMAAHANNALIVSPYDWRWRLLDYAGACYLFLFGLWLCWGRVPLWLVMFGSVETAALATWQALAPSRRAYEVRCNVWHLWVLMMYALAHGLHWTRPLRQWSFP
jgi:hypothetical protein